MDDNYTVILVISIAGLLTAIGATIRHIYKCNCCCINSKCNQPQEDDEKTPILSPSLDSKLILPQTIQDTIKSEISKSMTNLYSSSTNDVFYPPAPPSTPINIPTSPRPPRRSKHYNRLPSISDPLR